jgi:hypothetical protein
MNVREVSEIDDIDNWWLIWMEDQTDGCPVLRLERKTDSLVFLFWLDGHELLAFINNDRTLEDLLSQASKTMLEDIRLHKTTVLPHGSEALWLEDSSLRTERCGLSNGAVLAILSNVENYSEFGKNLRKYGSVE